MVNVSGYQVHVSGPLVHVSGSGPCFGILIGGIFVRAYESHANMLTVPAQGAKWRNRLAIAQSM